ncbi:MAG TPA: RIP metalloprotease RseP, partial [Methylophilaceae bacterium]|nr:RIP metalloprotease RseP [Methylophilaceae bacterium]
GKPVSHWDNLVNIVRDNPGRALALQVQRDGRQLSLTVTPDTAKEGDKKVGRIGAAYHMSQKELDRLLVTVKYDPFSALVKGAGKTWETSAFSLRMLGNMVIGEVSWKSLSGPVTIASYAGQSADAGWKTFLGFLAVVSISLGILNLLPIPVLDGGHLLYYMVEFIKGSPVSEKAMEVGHRIGFALLGILMACALFNDITRLITG